MLLKNSTTTTFLVTGLKHGEFNGHPFHFAYCVTPTGQKVNARFDPATYSPSISDKFQEFIVAVDPGNKDINPRVFIIDEAVPL